MTTVEFFDRTPIENIVSALTVVPDKIIFIGEQETMQENRYAYDGFFAQRGLDTKLEFREIKKNDLNDIVRVLTQIVEREDDCVFDLTGGEDLVLVAMGIVSQKYASKNVRMQRFNINNGVVTDCDGDGRVVYEGVPEVTVEEQILLHGGRVRYESGDDGRTYPWDITDEFIDDVRLMWEKCRKNPGLWNCQINILEIASSFSPESDPLEVYVEMDTLNARLAANSVEQKDIDSLLAYLQKNRIISGYVESSQILSFSFKDHQIKKCLTTAGLVLEMMVLVTALTVTHKNGDWYYTDAMNGVHIDWDGQFHQREDTTKDTENEVDAILMKGLIPLFVSCKNGQLKEDELYKLDAVANRFGGRFAKKVLIISYWGKKSPNPVHFRQRAKDMKINLVEGVHKLDQQQFESMIRHIINFSS